MKRIKMNVALIALILGIGGAVTTKAANSVIAEKWFTPNYDSQGNITGYQDVTSQVNQQNYECSANESRVCLRQFQNDDPSQAPVTTELGDYSE